DVDLRGQVHHRVVAAERVHDRAAIGDVGEHFPVGKAGRAALQHGDGVAASRSATADPSRLVPPVTRTFTAACRSGGLRAPAPTTPPPAICRSWKRAG